jgi:hypothetical protein
LTRHRIDGALDLLTVDRHRGVYLRAIADDRLAPSARVAAMRELSAAVTFAHDDATRRPTLPRDLRTALANVSRAADCTVAATAARLLVEAGERGFAPARPRGGKPAAMMRALCVLASYERQQAADEASYLLGYVPARGLELITVSYDAYSDTDPDGDGDPHTARTTTLVPRDEVVLPEIEDLVRAFARCDKTTCRTRDREFRFTFKPGPSRDLVLTRLEVIELPPCP